MLSEQLHKFTRIMRHEKWSEAEAIAVQISSIDPLESKFRCHSSIIDVDIIFCNFRFISIADEPKFL